MEALRGHNALAGPVLEARLVAWRKRRDDPVNVCGLPQSALPENACSGSAKVAGMPSAFTVSTAACIVESRSAPMLLSQGASAAPIPPMQEPSPSKSCG